MRLATIAVLGSALAFGAATVATRARAAPQQQTLTYQGTIQAVQPDSARLALITGVGLALRLVEIRLAPATTVASAGATLSVAALKPGDVVQAVCHLEDGVPVAERIERIPQAGSAGGPPL